MSVIVRRPQDGAIVLYCKGADSAILSQLASNTATAEDDEDPDIASLRQRCITGTENHLNVYAAEGLRTLCIARRVLAEDEYTQWRRHHRESELALVDRDRLLWESACSLETSLELLGGSGIEDRLQQGVPEAIATLRAAGLKVWVLTGDKQETAINIAYSCKLLEERSVRIILNAKTREECAEMIKSWLSWILVNVENPQMSISMIPETTHLALIIDGHTLAFTIEKPLDKDFVELAAKCHVVICCRAAPIQKASVVKLVKENMKVMTMAVGDGANDVSMIQMSDVGVGICGQEGMQAVMASDFALAQFKFLVPLLLAHGHWCYYRISKVMVYFFYKNAMFVFLLFWFQLFNGFSGSNAIDDISLIFFNLIFTSLPPIVMGILDQDISANELKRKPWLYKQGQESRMYSRKLFWITITDALYQSLVLFFACYWVYNDTTSGLLSTGITLHQIAVITVSLQLAMDTSYWTIYHHLILWLSVLASYVWCLVYSVLDPKNRMYFVAIETMKTKEFWLLLLLAPIVALLPKYTLKALKCSLHPNDVQRAQIFSRSEGPVLTSYTRQPTEET